MRILIAVGHWGVYSGAAHQALYQIAGLKRAGCEVAAVWGGDAVGDRGGFERLEALDVPLHLMPIHRRPTVRSLRAFRAVLRGFQPDVVECFKSGAQYHALYAGIGLSRHALLFYRGVGRRMDFWQGLKYRLRRVDRVIANCRALKRIMALTGRVPAAKIDVVPGEYDPACGDPEALDAGGLKAELGIAEGLPMVIQLGNWAPWRGQRLTLEAAARLKGRGCRFRLLFVGLQTDRLRPDVERLGLQGMVTLLPYRRDPERLLKISDIAVNSSTDNESLSGALLNAQAMGIPAVASRLCGNPEAVEDGVTGLVVPVGDAAALADAIGRLLEMPAAERARMGARARERARRLFSSEERTAGRLEAYRRALQRRGG